MWSYLGSWIAWLFGVSGSTDVLATVRTLAAIADDVIAALERAAVDVPDNIADAVKFLRGALESKDLMEFLAKVLKSDIVRTKDRSRDSAIESAVLANEATLRPAVEKLGIEWPRLQAALEFALRPFLTLRGLRRA